MEEIKRCRGINYTGHNSWLDKIKVNNIIRIGVEQWCIQIWVTLLSCMIIICSCSFEVFLAFYYFGRASVEFWYQRIVWVRTNSMIIGYLLVVSPILPWIVATTTYVTKRQSRRIFFRNALAILVEVEWIDRKYANPRQPAPIQNKLCINTENRKQTRKTCDAKTSIKHHDFNDTLEKGESLYSRYDSRNLTSSIQ